MRIDCEWMVLAEKVIEDSRTNNLSLVSCLEQVNAHSFPAHHHGFAVAARFRCRDAAPSEACPVRLRLVRVSDHDPEEVVCEVDSTWEAGLRTARWVMSFRLLRLKRAETLHFRLDHKVGRASWRRGPSTSLDVVQWDLSEEDKRALSAELQARGLPSVGLSD